MMLMMLNMPACDIEKGGVLCRDLWVEEDSSGRGDHKNVLLLEVLVYKTGHLESPIHNHNDDVDDKDGVVDDHLAHVGSGEPVVGVEYVQCPVLLESVVVSRVEQVQLVLEQLSDNLKISW